MLIHTQTKLNINTNLTQLVIESKIKYDFSLSFTQIQSKKPINKKGHGDKTPCPKTLTNSIGCNA